MFVFVLIREKSSDGRSYFDFLDVQPTELIVDPIVDKITSTFCVGFLIPNRDTAIVSFNTNAIVLHDQAAIADSMHTSRVSRIA